MEKTLKDSIAEKLMNWSLMDSPYVPCDEIAEEILGLVKERIKECLK